MIIKKGKKGIFLFVLIILVLFSHSVLSAEIVVLTEFFEYNDTFSNHEWITFASTGNTPNYPVYYNSIDMSPYVFGYNTTDVGGGASFIRYIERNLPVNVSNGSISVDFYIDDRRGLQSPSFSFQFLDNAFVNIFLVRVGFCDGATDGITRGYNNMGGDDCTLKFNYTMPYYSKISIDFDIDNNIYNIYHIGQNGTITDGCENKKLYNTSMKTLNKVRFNEHWLQNEDGEKYIDNILISVSITELLGLGDPCLSDGDCVSGNCEYGVCTLKGKNEECSSDIQCLSGRCVNGRCAKPTVWQGIDASKTQQFGDDSHSNNFIALFFIIGIPACFIWVGRSISAGFVAIGVFFFLSIFFTIVGWLSPFILIGNIMMGLIIVVFMFMLKGSSD